MIKIDIILKIALPAPSEPATALLDAPALSLPFPSTSGNLHRNWWACWLQMGLPFMQCCPVRLPWKQFQVIPIYLINFRNEIILPNNENANGTYCNGSVLACWFENKHLHFNICLLAAAR